MRILLVEDDRALNRSLVKLLKTQNYSVDPAFDGQEALDHLLGVEYDLIILDVMMPQMDGFTFILNCQIKLEKNYLLIRNILYEYF